MKPSQTFRQPSIGHYADAVANPRGMTRTLGEPEAIRDARGNVRFTAGNSAAVFPVVTGGRKMMLKCYIKPPANARAVCAYFAENPDPLIAGISFLPEELFVYNELNEGAFHDIVAGEWIEGTSLETEIRRAVREENAEKLEQLAAAFDRMALELLSRPWAHGDLKPENIMVTPAGEMKLVDLDAVFAPGLENASGEVGTPTYQHPARGESLFGPELDDYPAALISASLHALALSPALYGRYNTTDNIIFHPGQILSGHSEAWREVLGLFAARGQHDLYALALLLASPSPRIADLVRVLEKAAAGVRPVPEQTPSLVISGPRCGFSLPGDEHWIEAVYDEATEFGEGLAAVRLAGRWRMIDARGELALDCGAYEKVKPFSCALAAVCRGGKWGYIDRSGNTVIEPVYELAASMREGKAAVKKDGRYGYITAAGVPLTDLRFDTAAGFREGRAEAAVGRERFLVDENGGITPLP